MPTERFKEILANFRHAMLITSNAEGDLHARPMAIADTSEDGDLFFATHVKSAKVEELTENSAVSVAMQDDRQFLAISGKGVLINDADRIRELYSPSWQAWFPEGADDPSIRLLKVVSERAEYWDYAGMQGLRFLFEAGRAVVTDDEIDYEDAIRHDRVELA